MKKVTYLDLHVIQSMPPSCLNRDDTGSPKTAIYGGVRRARVSSQAWKRAMRMMFRDYFDKSELGTRTLLVFGLIADEIIKLNPDISRDNALKMARDTLEKVSIIQNSKDENKVKALFFIGAQQAKNLAAYALGNTASKNEQKEIEQLLNDNVAVDVALFGRMVASKPLLNTDACAQVAHAISTHRIENEYDYFTAVDDLSPEDNTGAGMVGTIEYNSATLYRYATVAAHSLYKELGGQSAALEKAIREFTRAFINSIPTGKQNTFAAHTAPDTVMAVIREDRPLNLAGAFETPVRGEGLVQASALALESYAQSIYDDFCVKPAKAYIVGKHLNSLGERLSLDELLVTVGKDVTEMVMA